MNQIQRERIKRAQCGDAIAFEEIYENYYQLVFYYAWNLSKNEADARDITQEVFLQVYKSISSLRDINVFTPWLRKITLSKAKLLYRSHKDVIYDPEQLNSYFPAEEDIPHTYMANLTDREILEGLMLRLSQRRYEVLDLFYFQQMSLHEIASYLNISTGTVKSRLHEARQALNVIVTQFEQREQRKLTFRLDPKISLASFGLLYYFKQIFSNSHALTIANAVAVTSCVMVTGIAVTKTYEAVHDITSQSAMVQTAPSSSDQGEKIVFSTVMYQNQVIDSTSDAYFALLNFAPDVDALKLKSIDELLEIQMIVQQLSKSDNRYIEILEETGWISMYQSLL